MAMYNAIFCFLKSTYYSIFDSIYLYYGRRKFEKNYSAYNKFPLVSILIATYNRANILISRTLPSVLNQTYSNIEVIVVGDCCIDETPHLLNNFYDKRVKFYDLPKRGKYPENIKERWFVQGTAPRNKAMQLAKGDWFVFISDDDVMYPMHIETLLKNAFLNNLEFISASYETIKNGEKIIVEPAHWGNSGDIYIGGMQTWLYRSYLKTFKWNIDAWRKKWNRPVDYDLQNRFVNAGVKIGHINDIVYFNPPVEGTNTTGYQAALLIND